MACILVIEDNLTNLELMRTVIQGFGHVPILARDGVEGIEMAIRERPHLILIDMLMPEMNGDEVLRRLKLNPDLHATPMVAVTALAMVGDREKVMSAGFDGYISKPISPRKLMDEINGYLRPEIRSVAMSPGSQEAPKPT